MLVFGCIVNLHFHFLQSLGYESIEIPPAKLVCKLFYSLVCLVF